MISSCRRLQSEGSWGWDVLRSFKRLTQFAFCKPYQVALESVWLGQMLMPGFGGRGDKTEVLILGVTSRALSLFMRTLASSMPSEIQAPIQCLYSHNLVFISALWMTPIYRMYCLGSIQLWEFFNGIQVLIFGAWWVFLLKCCDNLWSRWMPIEKISCVKMQGNGKAEVM